MQVKKKYGKKQVREDTSEELNALKEGGKTH